MLMTLTSAFANDIFSYHEEFRFLLPHSESLEKIPKSIDLFAANLNNEVEVFAAEDLRSSSKLLYTSTSMLLLQHAALVDVYTQTRYFKDTHIQLSIDVLLKNCHATRMKCRKYIQVVKRPLLFQALLNLDEIAKDIITHLGKYEQKPAANPPVEQTENS